MKRSFLIAAPLALAGCTAIPPPGPPAAPDGIARAGLGQRVHVDGPYVTPLSVIEDSRCPMNARCVWAGRTRLSVRIDYGPNSETREITSDEPISVANGRLSLVEVRPDLMAGQEADLADYRFGFTFEGGF